MINLKSFQNDVSELMDFVTFVSECVTQMDSDSATDEIRKYCIKNIEKFSTITANDKIVFYKHDDVGGMVISAEGDAAEYEFSACGPFLEDWCYNNCIGRGLTRGFYLWEGNFVDDEMIGSVSRLSDKELKELVG